MKSIIRMVSAVTFCAFSIGAAPASAALAAQYQLELSVTRDNVVVSEPTVVVKEGKQADLSIQDAAHPDEAAVRMLVAATTVAPVATSKETVQVDVSFFERIDGEWVLRGEPSIEVYVGQAASITLDSSGLKRAAPTYQIEVIATHASTESTVDGRVGSVLNAGELISPSAAGIRE